MKKKNVNTRYKYSLGGISMSDKQIKDSYENSSKGMSGQNATIGSKINDSNDPNMHNDLHENIKVNYKNIEK